MVQDFNIIWKSIAYLGFCIVHASLVNSDVRIWGLFVIISLSQRTAFLSLYELSMLNNLVYRFYYRMQCKPRMGTKVLCTCWL